MGLSTNLISGLSSGFDWRSMIDELMTIERRPVDLVETRKREYEEKLTEWQSFNTKLLSLKTAAAALKDPEDFALFTSTVTTDSSTIKASDLMSVSTTSDASMGSYSIKVTQLATAQKLSSKGFSTYDTALQLSGEFVINGRAVSVDANDDLMDIRNKINNLNTGTTPTEVTATILSVGSSDHRLILTSETTGKAGIDLKDASAETNNILQGLGFTYSSSGTSKTIKNVMGTSIQRTDYFASRTSAVGTLLGLTSAQSSSSITVGDKSDISINLATDSLDDIKDAIDAAGPTGVTTSIVETTVDGQTMYYLKIEGTATFGDKNNILETIGILKSDLEAVSAEVLTADRANTDSGTAITSTTRWRDIDGADVSINDRINISGTDHNGNSVSASYEIDSTWDTVQELLDEIEDTFGNVTASIIDGKIRVTDNAPGDSQLMVILTEHNDGGGALDFGNIETTTVNVANNRNTTDGSTAITSSTRWRDIHDAGVSAGDTITISGTDHNGNSISASYEINDTEDMIQELLDAIETACSNTVTASITSEGRIQIVDDSSGASYLGLTLTENNEGGGSLDFGVIEVAHGGSDRELLAGKDATLSVDGLQVTSADNTVEDIITGVTLNLLKADTDTTITVNIDRDVDALMDMFSTFVDAYNEVASYIRQQQTYDTESETTGGILFGDGTLSSVKTDLTSIMVRSVWGVSSEFSIPGLVGINLDNEGQLSIDADTLRGYLETNFNDVKSLFSANGTTSVGTLDYISHSQDTQAGEYTVSITQAATQGTTTSDTAVSGTLGSDETLTITEGDKTATIALTSAMTISDIINAVNTELDTVYTEILVGSAAVTETGAPITSSTKWADVDGAQLVDGDIIAFEGTSRSGSSVSGSYKIDDVSSDTVQGLLSAIELAYSNQVTASIDSSGHIVLTDKSAGNSQLALTFDYTQTTNQVDIFGTVQTTNPGGQEGRYALAITASNDGSDHLMLTHDTYGSDHTFIVSETNDLLWTGGDQTIDNGLDVAGTINGESATGLGQILTGDDEQANVDGLVIKYTGTVTGDVGNIKLTLGTAELFDRVLFNIADTYEGYVAFKQDSLQDTIDNLETQIEQMEARLSAKMENMINRFVAMEVALSKIQSQSQWLSGQINGLYGSWGWI
jgi:flagellar hook-associated protein 2